MKTDLKAHKKLSFYFSFAIHAIILVLLIEGNKKKLLPKTSMIEVELTSTYESKKETLKLLTSGSNETIERQIPSKKPTSSIANKSVKNIKSEVIKLKNNSLSHTPSDVNKKIIDDNKEKKLSEKSFEQTNTGDFSINHQSNKRILVPKSNAKYKIGTENNPHPTYPLIARKKGWEGRVIIQAKIDNEGNVAFIKIKESSGVEVLDNISLKTLKKWKFTPAKLGNKFIHDVVEIPVKFQLTD